MVYQEQVMQIAQVIGGYTLGGADLLRRAMGKKKPEEMAQAARHLPSRAREKNGVAAAKADAALRPDGEVRRLRLQQVARRRLRADRLPDRLLQGAPSGGVHGGQPVARDGRHRQGAAASTTTRSRSGLTIAAARRQRVELSLRAGRREARSATAWARSRAPAQQRDRGDRRRARRAAARSATCSISAGASTSASSTGAWSRR